MGPGPGLSIAPVLLPLGWAVLLSLPFLNLIPHSLTLRIPLLIPISSFPKSW